MKRQNFDTKYLRHSYELRKTYDAFVKRSPDWPSGAYINVHTYYHYYVYVSYYAYDLIYLINLVF